MTQKDQKSQGIGATTLAAAYIGVVVGAGFASGQEIWQFFGVFGAWGYVGMALSSVLFACFGWRLLQWGAGHRCQGTPSVLRRLFGRFFRLVDIGMMLFLSLTLIVMCSGAGAMGKQTLSLPSLAGSIVMAVLTALTVRCGFLGLLRAVAYVVPFLLLATLGIAIMQLMQKPVILGVKASLPPATGNVFWSCLLYAAYNLPLALPVLIPMGGSAKSRKTLLFGAILGALGLGLSGTAVLTGLLCAGASAQHSPLPMLHIAGGFSPVIQTGYGVILLMEIYTTACGALFGLVDRVGKKHQHPVLWGATIAAVIFGQIGFASWVRQVFPVMGVAGLALMVMLTLKKPTSTATCSVSDFLQSKYRR